MAASTVGVLGATSLVGQPLLSRVVRSRRRVLACSRHPEAQPTADGIAWRRPDGSPPTGGSVTHWIALCPPWATVAAFDWLVDSGAIRVVALSSTSIVTKLASPDSSERRLAARLAAAEEALAARADRTGVTLVILRPTMIYDGHSDGNVAAIAAFARRFGWFPLCGHASGLRQPVHADDVAAASLAALDHESPLPTYTLSGGEVVMFHELVTRACRSHGLSPRVVHLPSVAWHCVAFIGRWLGLASGATAGTAARMNEDLSCSHHDASRDLGFDPRPFLRHDVAADECGQNPAIGGARS